MDNHFGQKNVLTSYSHTSNSCHGEYNNSIGRLFREKQEQEEKKLWSSRSQFI